MIIILVKIVKRKELVKFIVYKYYIYFVIISYAKNRYEINSNTFK